jgi:DNA-binding YbaB/EbfC family protein
MFDMFKMLGKMNEVQEKMKEAKAQLDKVSIQESELGGVVVVDITGNKKITKITTSPAFYEKYTVEEREAILTEAVNNALDKADAYAKEYMAGEMRDVVPNIPGMDLGSLMGGFGG